MDEDVEIPSFDESAMGGKGEPFTDADLGVVARYMATFADFKQATSQEKWAPFAEKYPQRSSKSWAEFYRRNERRLDLIAAKIREHNLSKRMAGGEESRSRRA